LYRNDGSTAPLWPVYWYSFEVYPSSDGRHVVQMGPWASDVEEMAVSFYRDGEELKAYRIKDLVHDESKLEHTVSHFSWRSSLRYDDKQGVLFLKLPVLGEDRGDRAGIRRATMRKIAVCLAAAVLSFTIGMPYIDVAFADAPGREWLIMVYVSGANDLGVGGFARNVINQLEKVGSSDKVTVVVKYSILGAGKDREPQFQRDAKTLLIESDEGNPEITSPVIDTSPRTDMASQSSLLLFLRKSMAKYPSKRVMLVLWGKGEGLKGALNDDLSGKRMSVRDMSQVLSKVRQETRRKMDVLAVDADLMQTAEIAYELKDEADIVIGSEESASGSHYRYDLTLQEVVETPTMSGRDLAGAMVYYAEDAVSSAARSDRIPAFTALLDRWVTAIMSDRAALKGAAKAVDGTFRFGMEGSRDLCDFIDRVTESVPSGSLVAAAGRELKSFIQGELVLATHWAFDPKILKDRPYGTRSHGLAIYLPDLVYDAKAYEPLAFASNSEWRRFLMAVLEERLKK
jgi:hypothetical protein